MCHSEQMGKQGNQRGETVRKCFGFCFYPRRSGPRNRVEYALSPFSSIRLSGGGKHGAHPPRCIIPLTLLSPLTPTSRRSSLTCAHYDLVEHTNTHRRTSSCQPIFFSLRRYLFFFQMAVKSLNTRTHTCTQASSYQHLRCHISC